MSEISISVTAQEELVLSVLRDLGNGQVEDATGHFADEFRFKDHGIGLEFKDKQRLAEFFQKTREFYPESVLETNTIVLSGDHVITEWTLQTILNGALLWRTQMEGSRLAAWGVNRAHGERQDYRLGRVLRQTYCEAHSPGVLFHGMD